MIKNSHQSANIIKAICDKPTTNMIFNGKKLKAFPVKSEDKNAHSFHIYLAKYWKFQQEQLDKKKWGKGIQTGREEVKLSLFADEMILYIYITLTSPQKLLKLIN